MKHIVVNHQKNKWCAVPANNGANGPAWQWEDELLVGFTCGEAQFTKPGHQVDHESPHESYFARSRDGGENWEVWKPENFVGDEGFKAENAIALTESIDFMSPGFVMRVEGNAYHGSFGQQWFYSLDKGASWKGPYTFTNLFTHPELAGKEFTGRTDYLVNSSSECFLFLSVRAKEFTRWEISSTDKVFLAKTTDGGKTFDFVSWVVPPADPNRAVMPSTVRITQNKIISAIRRRYNNECWIDCYYSVDNGQSWEFLSKVSDTGRGNTNGNPPAMILMEDGRICCVYANRDKLEMHARYSSNEGKSWGDEQVLRNDFKSINNCPELGYTRLFRRQDGKLVAVYFWCSPEMPETHIEATIF
jgi:hypothetical protein